jgi:hypothetical protein
VSLHLLLRAVALLEDRLTPAFAATRSGLELSMQAFPQAGWMEAPEN